MHSDRFIRTVLIEKNINYYTQIIKSGWVKSEKYFGTEIFSYDYVDGNRSTCNGTIVCNEGVLQLLWFSDYEGTIYKSKIELTKFQQGEYNFIIGLFPYGIIQIWGQILKKKFLLGYLMSENFTNDGKYFLFDPNRLKHRKKRERTTLLSKLYFLDKLRQFIYRYQVIFEKCEKRFEGIKWKKYNEEEKNIPEFEYIEESLFDGTFDKLHDEGLLKYHEAGKPKKLAIKWHIKKSEYTAYFWFEDEKICSIFERFYGAHPDTKTDFIIRIDAEQKKYELALFRQGLKEPQIIPEDAYQLLVFKNKFEHYRSDNYNQERGAWIW